MKTEIEELLVADQARWIVVEGYLYYPHHAITRDGRIWDNVWEKWRPNRIPTNRYEYARHELTYDGVTRKIKRAHLIKLVFGDPPSSELIASGKEIVLRHLNDIRGDDRLENLEWGTFEDNVEDARRNGKRN